MIAPPNSTAETMQRSVAFTMAALDAAAELDVDLNPEESQFLASEKSQLETVLDKLMAAQQALEAHLLKKNLQLQARVIVGDAVLDRGVRNAKTRLKMGLKLSKGDAPNFVFGSNLNDLVNAELRSEPLLVIDSANRLAQVPDFDGKAEVKKDLEDRASRQMKVLSDRDEGELIRSSLASSLTRTIADCSEALYRLEKRMLDRFPRERGYVSSFFLNAAGKRKTKQEPEVPTTV